MHAKAPPSEAPRLDRCQPRPPETLGVTVHDPERAQPGLTLCWTKGTRRARLIDLEGRERHRWARADGPPWHDAKLLANGNLLVVANARAYGRHQVSAHWLVELDAESRVVWESPARVHHDARRLENGNTLVVANAPGHHPELFAEPMIYDYLQEIDPDGKVVWQWHYAPHEPQLELPGGMEIPPQLGDWPHINTAERLPDTPAGRADERFRAGNVLVSPRHLHRIFVVERETGAIVWQWGAGEILGQHEPTMLENGHILLFDNGWGPPMRGWSRVIELDPLSGEIVWQYAAEPKERFWSPVGSGAQRLANGNTLICAMNWSEPGRVFEVTPAGAIAWEYWNDEGDSLYRAHRYDPAILEQQAG